jgi:hypothetical protein
MRVPHSPAKFPSPLWGGVRGGGNHDGPGIPPSLTLPHKGGGKIRRSHVFGLALIALLTLLLPTLDATAQSRRERPPEETPEQYPAGTHRDDTFYFCTACHGFKIVAQQGMSRERWNDTFDIMVKRHSMVDVQGEQREQMLDYLTAAFPERRAPGGWKNPFEGK